MTTNMFKRKLIVSMRRLFPSLLFAKASYAQEGEDIILLRMFDGVERGFYVDVGAHHPFRFSNSYAFYRRGWKGIVVDPVPGMSEAFAKYRPRDTAIEQGVAENPGILKYHVFNEPALNTFDSPLAEERQRDPRWTLTEVVKVKCSTLRDILSQHLPGGLDTIHFLSVDVEGYDLQVLRSNDWNSYRPLVIVAECLGSDLSGLDSDPVVHYLRTVGYRPFAKAVHSVFFKRER